MSAKDISDLSDWKFVSIGTVEIIGDEFIIKVDDQEVVKQDCCVYVFVVDDKVLRIGSSKAPLRSRFKTWERDVSKALKGIKSSTSQEEASDWREALKQGAGTVFARRGALILTPVGEICAYLSEESHLIGYFKNRKQCRLNHSSHR
jgi:hypothetical protein